MSYSQLRYRSGPVPAWNGSDVLVDAAGLQAAKEVVHIDEALIRRMFGYGSVEDYYYDASCLLLLKGSGEEWIISFILPMFFIRFQYN